MFTFVVRLCLLTVSGGIIYLPLQNAYVNRQNRRNREKQLLQEQAAHIYAYCTTMRRVYRREIDVTHNRDLQDAYEFEKIAYLNN